jgi:hypothetical protein
VQHTFSKSNHVRSFDYDPATKEVSVFFDNEKRYTHTGVPQEAIDNWTKYRSPGEFYHAVIKRYKTKVQK